LISGILVESFSRPGWWKRFYIRRSLRIFPLYYLSLLWALGIALIWRRELLSIIGVYALYLQDLPWVGSIVDQVPTKYLVLDHFWSLAVEEQFYLIWPFILFFLHRKRTAAIWFCIAACPLSLAFRVWALGVHPAIAGRQPWIYHAPLSHVGELCAGAALALAIRGTVAQRRRILRLAPYFYWSSVVMLAAIVVWTKGSLEYDDPRWITIGTVVLTIFYTFLLALALRPGLIQRFFQIAFLRWLGKISYGIYVYHLLLRPIFVGLAYRIAPLAKENLQALLVASIATVGTLSIASLSFYTFERFFLDMKSKFPNR
jgi:peptidoglycan/LPS O-acetylase OafA/YrhL